MSDRTQRILEDVVHCGVSTAGLAEDLEVSDTLLFNVRAGRRRLNDERVDTLRRALAARGAKLKSVGHTPRELRQAIELSSITGQTLANRLGISNQRLWQIVDGDEASEERRKDVQAELRKIGRELLRIAK